METVIVILLVLVLAGQAAIILLRARDNKNTDLSRIEDMLSKHLSDGADRADRSADRLVQAWAAQSKANAEDAARRQEALLEKLSAGLDGIRSACSELLASGQRDQAERLDAAAAAMRTDLAAMRDAVAKSGSDANAAMIKALREGREEQAASFRDLNRDTAENLRASREALDAQSEKLAGFQQTMERLLGDIRTASAESARIMGDMVSGKLDDGRKSTGASIDALKTVVQASMDRIIDAVNARLKDLQASNESRLDRMQAIVDEKLQKTLDSRLAASFKQVSDQLASVGQGLGEMKTLASDVGSLKNALTNVKARGTYGEVRCGKLLEDILAPGQFAANVNIKGANVVEYAVRLPGTGGGEVLLPIDSKFPIEDYNRLLDAEDKPAIEAARKALRTKVLLFAKDISDKYIEPPKTTGFALMFLPTEGLYAEVVRDASLFEELRDKYHVTAVGMTTLSAFLSSLQIGFKTLAIEKRSQDVAQSLAAVKSELGKFGEMLEKAQRQVQLADQTLGTLSGTRLNAINRKLRGVDALPETDSQRILGLAPGEEA